MMKLVTIVPLLDALQLHEPGLSLVVMCRQFCHMHFANRVFH